MGPFIPRRPWHHWKQSQKERSAGYTHLDAAGEASRKSKANFSPKYGHNSMTAPLLSSVPQLCPTLCDPMDCST